LLGRKGTCDIELRARFFYPFLFINKCSSSIEKNIHLACFS
jgi:hypothetical protein